MFCLFPRSKTQDGSQDVLNVMIFLEDFIYYSGLSRKVSRAFVDTNINIKINKEFHKENRIILKNLISLFIEESAKLYLKSKIIFLIICIP